MCRKPDFEWEFPQEQEWHSLDHPIYAQGTFRKRTLDRRSVFVEALLLLMVVLYTSYYWYTKALTNNGVHQGDTQQRSTQATGAVQDHALYQAATPIETLAHTLHLETAHLTFAFQAQDQALLTDITDQLETLYVDLYRILALEPVADQQKIAIEVRSDPRSLHWAIIDQRIVIHFPSAIKLANHQQKAQLFGQLLREALTNYLWEEAMRQFPVKQQWLLMMHATKLWLLQAEISPLPPLSDEEGRRLAVQRQSGAPQLKTLFFRWGSNWRSYAFQRTELLMAQRLIDYNVETAGLTVLPQLLRAFGRYDNWATLAPAVYGKTEEAFEADWHTYLAAEREELLKTE